MLPISFRTETAHDINIFPAGSIFKLSKAHLPLRLAFDNLSRRRKSDDIYVTSDDIEYTLYVNFDVHAKDYISYTICYIKVAVRND